MVVTIVEQPAPIKALWCVPLKDLLLDDPLFELGLQYDFTRNQLIDTVVGVADGLLGDDIDYANCGRYINKRLPSNPTQRDLVDCIIGIAERLVVLSPDKAQELLYVRTGYKNLYLRVTIGS